MDQGQIALNQMWRKLSQAGHACIYDHSILIYESLFLHAVYLLFGETFLVLIFITYDGQAGLKTFIELIRKGVRAVLRLDLLVFLSVVDGVAGLGHSLVQFRNWSVYKINDRRVPDINEI